MNSVVWHIKAYDNRGKATKIPGGRANLSLCVYEGCRVGALELEIRLKFCQAVRVYEDSPPPLITHVTGFAS